MFSRLRRSKQLYSCSSSTGATAGRSWVAIRRPGVGDAVSSLTAGNSLEREEESSGGRDGGEGRSSDDQAMAKNDVGDVTFV
jgi:hypothetical protein